MVAKVFLLIFYIILHIYIHFFSCSKTCFLFFFFLLVSQTIQEAQSRKSFLLIFNYFKYLSLDLAAKNYISTESFQNVSFSLLILLYWFFLYILLHWHLLSFSVLLSFFSFLLSISSSPYPSPLLFLPPTCYQIFQAHISNP